jgi:hypothetical protein
MTGPYNVRQSMISRRYRAAVIFRKYPMEGECAHERELLLWEKTMFMRFASVLTWNVIHHRS